MSKKGLELLAPAGKWESLETVIEQGADAVYLGGKRFNMRLLRPDFNFSDEQLMDAVSFAHDRGVKVYVTVNNLYFQSEINELADYLAFLEEAGCDGIIVQDLAVPLLLQRLGLKLPLHASVQMGVANAEAARFLDEQGFSRGILSKNLSLDEIRDIHQRTSLELEFFVHGDVCISHTGQCYMSSFFFGESANRGRCRKPCRWKYRFLPSPDRWEGVHYFLAHKDLCLVGYLDRLIEAGVRSFKIEGRMRDPEYAGFLVRCYRRALDALEAGETEVVSEAEKELYSRRIREFTTGSLFSRTGADCIGYSGEREPFFPTSSIEVTPLGRDDYPQFKAPTPGSVPSLSVKVGGLEAFFGVIGRGVDTVIIGGDGFKNSKDNWDEASLLRAIQAGNDKGVSVVLETPRIVTQKDLDGVITLLSIPEMKGLSAVMVHDLGSLRIARELGLTVWAGYGLNLTNGTSVKFLASQGVQRVTASLELKLADLKNMVEKSCLEIELMVQGPLCGMITDYCPIQAVWAEGDDDGCKTACNRAEYCLEDEYQQRFRILNDDRCRTHIFFPLDLCLFGYLPLIKDMGINSIRIEGHYYRLDTLLEVVDIYRDGLRDLAQGRWEGEKGYRRLLRLFAHGLTTNPLVHRLAGLEAD